VNLFPWTAAQLFSTSTHHPALRQSVLAVAALIADPGPQHGHVKALHHLQKALMQLQTQISASGADEGIAIKQLSIGSLQHDAGRLRDFEEASARYVDNSDETGPSARVSRGVCSFATKCGQAYDVDLADGHSH
jgi:hypothetical protein